MKPRADRVRPLIIQAFFDCLEETDFSELTVGTISSSAQINRSTFYHHFSDKYELRDDVMAFMIQSFLDHLEVNFLEMDILKDPRHLQLLKENLAATIQYKRQYEILWNQKLLGRNLFEEMIQAGAKKVECEILNNPDIPDIKKKYADWYARLLLNNYLVTLRWWFSKSNEISAQQIAYMMQCHMSAGTIPTLKSPEDFSSAEQTP